MLNAPKLHGSANNRFWTRSRTAILPGSSDTRGDCDRAGSSRANAAEEHLQCAGTAAVPVELVSGTSARHPPVRRAVRSNHAALR